jgi:23S rRNA pseudouridine1911/1915/1917 synthase
MPTITTILSEQGHSAKTIKSLLQTGKVFFQGMPTSDGRREAKVSEIEVRQNAPRLKPGRDPVILHRDDDFVVVYKPAGLLSVRAAGRHQDRNMMGFVYKICGEAYPVHRLDEDTSGLMLVALTEFGQKRLKEQLEARTVSRRYWALISGHWTKKKTIDNILHRDRGDGLRGTRDRAADKGQRAITHVQPLQKLSGATMVQCTLETGRTHQIRIHLSEAKHPVLGDTLYGSARLKERAPRLALHAYSLSFNHPRTGDKKLFRIPLADDLEKLRRTLEHDYKS